MTACSKPDVSRRMDQIVQSRAAAGQFSGAVLVARDGKVLLEKGYGEAEREWSIPNTPATRFHLASLSKQFTAAGVLLLAQHNQLNLDAPLKTYLPEAPPSWDRVTVLNLLNHTSGIPDYISAPDYAATQALPARPQQLVARFRDKPLDFPPGQNWTYSNSGYVLLGQLVEKLSGLSYAEFLRQNLFEPLGMRDSGYDDGLEVVPRLARGYRLERGAIAPAAYRHQSTLYAAGGLYSTTGDLLRWQQGLYGGKLLPPAWLQRMTTPGREKAGLGLLVLPLEDHVVYEHGGGVDGAHTLMSYDPNLHISVIVLANLQDADVVSIHDELAALARGETVVLPAERKDFAVPAQTLAKYAGAYEFAPGFGIVFSVENGQLMGQATGQQQYPATAEAPGMFYF
ncbi:MAG: serine hydrolase, partial [Nevskia sp.]|nr:serine hydrolase [Nevskia sp.]